MKLRILILMIVLLLFLPSVQAVEIIDNYEDGSYYGEYPWQTVGGLPTLNIAYTYNGNYGARYAATAGTPAQSSAYWNYRDIDLTDHDTLSFWVNERVIGSDAEGWGGYFTITVQDGGSWVFNYLDTPSQTWEYHEIDVSGLSGVKRIQVNWKAVWGNTEVWLDDIMLDYVPIYTLSGNVTSSSIPIEGASVSIHDDYGSNGSFTAITNETGFYQLTVTPPGVWRIQAAAFDYDE